MKKQFSIQLLLRSMTRRGFDYFVLRGFHSPEQLEREGGDVDIYVSPKYRNSLHLFLVSQGFYTPRFNPARYKRRQYIFIDSSRIYKVDVHFGFYFSEKLLKAPAQGKHSVLHDGIRVANPTTELNLFLYHLAFDKSALSDNNRLRLTQIIDDYRGGESDKVRLAKNLLQGNLSLEALRGEIIGPMAYSALRYIAQQIVCRRLSLFCYGIGKYARNRTVAIVGIDGSGKSTTIEALAQTAPSKLRVQYMGNKQWRTKLAKRYTYENHKVLALIITYFEMWHRLLSSRTKSQITIFDRYSWETYYLASKKARPIFYFFYRLLPPRPKLTYYLHCPAEVSLSRKDDISDPKKFVETKRKTDTFFEGRKGVVNIDTSKTSTEDIVSRIMKDMGEHMLPYFY